jgi:hypothetical protein
MNATELSEQAERIADSFSKQDLARLVVALKGDRQSLQHALEVVDTLDSRLSCTLEEAWAEVRAGENREETAQEE